jgi:hypothetical protein
MLTLEGRGVTQIWPLSLFIVLSLLEICVHSQQVAIGVKYAVAMTSKGLVLHVATSAGIEK